MIAKAVIAVCLLFGAVAADGAAASTGDLTQKAGTAGCISETGAGPCVDGTALSDSNAVTVSPDGKSAYVASNTSDAVAVFDRTTDGTLTQKAGTAGCISETGAGPCVDGTALNGAGSVTVSPDGKNAYVASFDSNAVSIFDRSPDGTLTQKVGTAGCISETGAGPCVDGTALSTARSVAVSPDGKSAYVLGFSSDAVAVFDRAADGTLTQKAGTAGCISETGAGPCADGTAIAHPIVVTISSDGKNAYIASSMSGAVSVFDRALDGTLTQKSGNAGCISNTGAGPCADGTALGGANSVSISPDGKSAYASSLLSDAVVVFDRAADGELTQKAGTTGCFSDTGAGPCSDGTALVGATSVAVSPDGNSAYVTASGSYSVAEFDRAMDGSLTQKPGTAGCISETGAGPCGDGTAIAYPNSVAVSPDGRNAYVVSLISDAVAVFDREPAPSGIKVEPLSLGFGTVEVGRQSATKSFTVKSIGTIPLSLGTISSAGTNPAQFSVDADTCSSRTLPVNATCTATVTFTPSSAGSKTANLKVMNDSPTGAVSVALSGIGKAKSAPKTTFKQRPKKKYVTRKRAVRKIRVAFKSNQAGAKFKCRLDRKKFRKCKSPHFLKKVKSGRHVFKVKASKDGKTGKPAVTKFRVVRKK
ncbi:MAG: beta-propeller fold lactonase family protein [Thermoleophilia bacterium]|nr:beta-propeller fold lactonase family protein [Thermoleophilia bacterium]